VSGGRVVLLDTHTLLWALVEPERLSQAATDALVGAGRRLVSAASFWELAIKHHAGRLPQAGLLLDDWEDTVARLLGESLPIGPEAAIVAARLPWDHKDPFDRMLAAQATLADAALVTKDSTFDSLKLPGFTHLW
jgi:PIN domain nuclease of toxin-antitoxin system